MGDRTLLSRTPRYITSALTGALLGLATVVYDILWERFTGQAPFAWRTLGDEAAVALIAGAVVGLVHHVTRKIRRRGRLYEYASWMTACTIGVFVVIAPELLQNGFWWTALFALWLGVSAGLGFGVISRHLKGHRSR